MTKTAVQLPEIVDAASWRDARRSVSEAEAVFLRSRHALRERWRGLPMTPMSSEPMFEGTDGNSRLIDVFEGRRQLMIYHFWFERGGTPCDGCSMWTKDLGDLGGGFAHLHDKQTTLAYVSRATPDEIVAVKADRDWRMPWYSLVDEGFNEATGYEDWAQISIFVRKGDAVYLTNTVPFDDLVTIGNHWTLLERTPLGGSFEG
ncbi:MAG: DUF899 domain-containing protein [Hyphomonas sp.]|nr:DUF899 domain-containing protein [Hyphomonas sp.]